MTDIDQAIEAATDALEVFFNVEEPVTIIPRHQITNIATLAVMAAAPHLQQSGGIDG